jgi:hypothetical protein
MLHIFDWNGGTTCHVSDEGNPARTAAEKDLYKSLACSDLSCGKGHLLYPHQVSYIVPTYLSSATLGRNNCLSPPFRHFHSLFSLIITSFKKIGFHSPFSSVVDPDPESDLELDPDPVGLETFCRIRSKSIRIRIWALAALIPHEFETKLL